MALLSSSEIAQRLGELSGWTQAAGAIRKEYQFPDFVGAIGFVVRVALLAQRANHHPDIEVHWNRVVLALWTHSEGGLTERDFKLAAQIDRLEGPPHSS